MILRRCASMFTSINQVFSAHSVLWCHKDYAALTVCEESSHTMKFISHFMVYGSEHIKNCHIIH